MRAIDFNSKLVNGYLKLLSNLDTNDKLELIAKLTDSVRQDLSRKKDAAENAFGTWDEADDAEEIIKTIRNSRNFDRHTEQL